MFHHQILGGGSFAVNSAYISYLNVYKETEEAFNSVERRLSYAPFKNVPRKQTQFFRKKRKRKPLPCSLNKMIKMTKVKCTRIIILICTEARVK